MKTIDIIAAILLIIGGINWGLIGIANTNIVDTIFANSYVLAKIVYTLVGLSALWQIFQWKAMKKRAR